jgi:hypothetical protein
MPSGWMTLLPSLAEGGVERLHPSGLLRALAHFGGVGSILVTILVAFVLAGVVEGLWLAWLYLSVGSPKRNDG